MTSSSTGAGRPLGKKEVSSLRGRQATLLTGKLYMAIDVGTTKVCTLIAQVASNGELKIVGAGVVPSRGMRKGLVVHVDEMAQAIRASVEDATEDLDQTVARACIGVTGSHIVSLHTRGVLENLNGDPYEVITRHQMDLAIKNSYPTLSPKQELLHVIPRTYSVDSLQGVHNPAGLKGHRLSVEANAVVGEAASMDNLVRAMEHAGLSVKSMVMEPLASAEAVLSGEEKEMGVVLVDIGGGTTDVAVFKDGAMIHTAVIPVAGYQFTNDLAVAFGVPYEAAETAKLRYGHAIPEAVSGDETIKIQGYDGEKPIVVRRRELCRVLNDRGSELLRLILLKVRDSGLEVIPRGGMVFTGGGAKLPGWEDLTKELVHTPARIAAPRDIAGLPDDFKSPTYSTSVGILLWGIHHPTEQRAYHRSNGKGHLWKGRWWLRWIGQFIGPKE